MLTSLLGAVAPVAAAGPLSITNVDSPDPVQSGGQILYTVTVTNTGGAAVNNIVLTDQINGIVGFGNPPLLDVVSTQGTCSQTNTQITCLAGTLAGRGVWTVTIRGIVTAAAGTTLNNIATVVATKSAQTYTTSAAATTQVQGSGPGGPSPDLTIAKNGPLHVTPLATITYTLTINNLGTGNAVDVKVTDTIPGLVTIDSVATTSLFTCEYTTPLPMIPPTPTTVVCTGGRVNAGSNASITINGTVGPSPATSLENTSVVDPDNTIDEGELGNTADAAELNNFSNTVVTEVSPNPPPPPAGDKITIDKQGPASAIPGELVTYTVVVENGLLGRADYVTMTDGTQGLQAGSLTVLSAVAESGTDPQCVVAAPTVECTMTRLQIGDTLTVIIQGMVVAPAGSTIINSASVNANIKNTGYTARDEVQTIINAGKDFSIAKSDSPDPVCASSFPPTVPAPTNCKGGLTYTFLVGNSGVQTALGVVVRDPLPPGTTYDDAATDAANLAIGTNVNCNEELPVGSNIVVCVISTLGPVSTQTIKVVLAAPPTLGTITNTVTVDPSNAFLEADETNNIAVATTTVATGIDLTIKKDDETSEAADVPPNFNIFDALPGFDPIATSGTQTYTIIVDNLGTQDATGIRVRDALPAGATFLSATADNGFTCSHAAGVVECIDGSILGTASESYFPPFPGDDTATIIIKIFAMPNVGLMHNEVRVDPLNEIGEYNETNNFDFEDTVVGTGNADVSAFNQLTIVKTQTSPDPGPVATNGTLIYNLRVSNLGTDPVSNVVVKDFLPTGSRFISAADTAAGPAAFFCSHDGAATGGVVTCTGGDFSGTPNTIPGVPTFRDITVTVFAPNTPGTVTNRGTVDPDNIVPEGNEFDNDSAIPTVVTVGGANMFNELTVTKEQSLPVGGTVATSSIVTYTIVVTNSGTDPAFNVRLSDVLPAGFTFISALDSSGPADPFRFICVSGAGNSVDCTGATLSGVPNAAGTNPTSRTIVLRATSSAIPATYTNTVIVDPGNAIPEGNETNNTANAQTIVENGGPGAFIDLTILKSGSLTATPGGRLNYSLLVTNTGSAAAFNVKVRDVMPAHVTFLNARDSAPGAGSFTCTYNEPTLDCGGGFLPAGGSRIINIVAVAPTNLEQFAEDLTNISVTVTNQAFVDPDNAILEGDETNNAHSIDTVVSSAINLTLDKQGPGSATQNDMITYTITVKNETVGAGGTAFGVKIVDALPTGLIPLNITAEPGNFICSLTENPVNSVTCIGDLETDQTVVVTIEAFVTLEDGTLDNEACVDPDSTIDESNELDNCKHSIGQVLPPAPDLSINKSASTSSVTSGQELVYTLSVSNVGTGPTTAGITVSDTVPPEVTVTDINPDGGWDCSTSTGNVVTCTRPDLANGESSGIVVTTTAGAALTSPFTNTATVTGGGDAQANNNSDSVTTSVGGAAIDLTITSITDEPDAVNRGNQLTYTIIARNDGTSGASPDAVVRVELPDMGTTVQGVTGTNGFNCSANLIVDPSGDTYDCVGDFAASGSPGDSTEITAIVTVNADAPNDLKTTVTVDPDNAFGESIETNNTLDQTTTVTGTVCTSSPCVDLVVADVFDSPDPATSGGTFTYVATIVNVGDAPVDPTAIWNIHFQYFGTGSPSLDIPTGVSCAVLPLPEIHHVHCTSTGGTDGMDLGPGAGLIFTVTVTGASAGMASLNVQADVEPAAITEFSESNNAVTETTTIVDP